MTPKEVEDVFALLRKPDVSQHCNLLRSSLSCTKSHFVKVPSLPYHHLAAILRKFPADMDSKVLHTSAIKRTLVGASPSDKQGPVLISMIEFVQVAAEELRLRADKGESFALPAMQSLAAAVFSCKGVCGQMGVGQSVSYDDLSSHQCGTTPPASRFIP